MVVAMGLIAVPWGMRVNNELTELRMLCKATSKGATSSAVPVGQTFNANQAGLTNTPQQTVHIAGPLLTSKEPADKASADRGSREQQAATRKRTPACTSKRRSCATQREVCLVNSKLGRTSLAQEREVRDDCNREFGRCVTAADVFCD